MKIIFNKKKSRFIVSFLLLSLIISLCPVQIRHVKADTIPQVITENLSFYGIKAPTIDGSTDTSSVHVSLRSNYVIQKIQWFGSHYLELKDTFIEGSPLYLTIDISLADRYIFDTTFVKEKNSKKSVIYYMQKDSDGKYTKVNVDGIDSSLYKININVNSPTTASVEIIFEQLYKTDVNYTGSVSPESWNEGDVTYGSEKSKCTFTLTNTGETNLFNIKSSFESDKLEYEVDTFNPH